MTVADLLAERRRELEAEIARLRSIIHRAHAQALSYNLREAIVILNEITADEDGEGDG